MDKIKCVYCLDFPNGRKYVGSTTNLRLRINNHNSKFDSKNQPELKAAIREYGLNVVILEQFPDSATKKDMYAREQHYLDLWWDYGILYNKSKKAHCSYMKGVPKSAQHRAALSKARMGMSPWNKGRKGTPEERLKRLSPVWQHVEEIKRLRAEGMSHPQLAKMFNSSNRTIRTICLS